jgi:hypothetical protein
LNRADDVVIIQDPWTEAPWHPMADGPDLR